MAWIARGAEHGFNLAVTASRRPRVSSAMPITPPFEPSRTAPDAGAALTPLQWAEIVQQLGAEIAGPMSLALAHVQALSVTGQIDRRSLHALQQAVAAARNAGMLGQQLARLASGRLRLNRERQALAQMLRQLLAQRSADTQSRGLQVRQLLEPIEIWADGTLLFSLLSALLDWALDATHTAVELRLSRTPWPSAARLSCRFTHRALDQMHDADEAAAATDEDSLAWRLVAQTALTLGASLRREQEAGATVVTLQFLDVVESAAPDAHPAPSPDASPNAAIAPIANPAFSLMVVSPDPSLARDVALAAQSMQAQVQACASLPEAASLLGEAMPQALLIDQTLLDADAAAWLADLRSEAPGLIVIELRAGRQATRLSTATDDGLARIAREHLPDALPELLRFELARRR
jgi:hypothetical protein